MAKGQFDGQARADANIKNTIEETTGTQLKGKEEAMEKVAQYQDAMPQGSGHTYHGRDMYNKAAIENTPLDGALGKSHGSVENPQHGTSAMDSLAQDIGPAQSKESLNAARKNTGYRAVSVTKEGDPIYVEEARKMIQKRLSETTEAAKEKMKEMKLGEDYQTGAPITAASDIGTIMSKEIFAGTSKNNDDQMRTTLTSAFLKAVCVLEGPNVTGTITFAQEPDNPTIVEGEIRGCTPGKHGLHIQALGDTTNGCNSTGPHFNPQNVEHGDLGDEVRHAGDLGNVIADNNGIAKILIKNNLLHLSGKESALGRALVIHADPDDLGQGGHEQSKLTGNAGARIACGIIGLQTMADRVRKPNQGRFETLDLINEAREKAKSKSLNVDQVRQTLISAPIKAVCILEGSSNVTGIISFAQDGTNPTVVEGEIRGLSTGRHGLHIHALGDTTNGCNSTGPHFNPNNVEHGDLSDDIRHAGDLGNAIAGTDGIARILVTNNLLHLSGKDSCLGRALVIHADPDDLGHGGHEQSKLTGNAGARLACGIIGLQAKA